MSELNQNLRRYTTKSTQSYAYTAKLTSGFIIKQIKQPKIRRKSNQKIERTKIKQENHYFIYLLLTFIVNMKQKQAKAISYSHCVSSLACASIFRNQEKENSPAFQEFFGQRFRYHGTKPLTKKPEVSENHTLPYPSPLNKPPHPKETAAPSYS